MNLTNPHSSASDFDFFIGRWHVVHRKLKKRLANCRQWDEFSGKCSTRKILDGYGNFDDNRLDMPQQRYCAATIRTYHQQTGEWSIWWLDGRFPDQLDTPMRGRFIDGVGTFYADDIFEDQPIKVRFLWTRPTPDTPRWEQAFSTDGGQTWETNWIMMFSQMD